MPRTTNTAGQAAAVEFAHDVAQFWDRQLGQRLFGIYLIGSLAHGGFSARYSDIDMALIAEGRLRPPVQFIGKSQSGQTFGYVFFETVPVLGESIFFRGSLPATRPC